MDDYKFRVLKDKIVEEEEAFKKNIDFEIETSDADKEVKYLCEQIGKQCFYYMHGLAQALLESLK
jgi:hypothetical protein